MPQFSTLPGRKDNPGVGQGKTDNGNNGAKGIIVYRKGDFSVRGAPGAGSIRGTLTVWGPQL